MTVTDQNNSVEQKQSDKEYNFRLQEQKYLKMLESETERRVQAEMIAKQYQERQEEPEEEEDETYIDKKKLDKKLAKFGQQAQKQTQNDIQVAVTAALKEERKQNWLKQHPDFYDILQHAPKLQEQDPDLADSLLEMPEGFERQKLVYKNIKALGVHKPKVNEPTIQDKIDANQRSHYYQPSGIGSAPYAQVGDFSPQGQKSAYDKIQQLKANLRI